MSDTHPLTSLPRALLEAGYEGTTYRAVYARAVDGAIPASQGKNGRWTFQLADLPQIAEALSLSDAHAA
ncbi:hypothetical protein LVO79_21120 (plasmid) [Roseivivax marinus]|uniref:hypothetical protein n=1 Tax=Roseivivax marinus TaxID=1379903 RepID=UPI001F0471E1|nr:hypothetical protein [Roseivivax marinus]UMA67283.1 hypothetical protein LVO79_21120 [Roseivivax marinus]